MTDTTDLTDPLKPLVVTALLGSGSRPPPPLDLPPALGALLNDPADEDREGHLLVSAAALDLWRRAGRLPDPDPRPRPVPCPAERLASCPPAARSLLQRALDHLGDQPRWLIQWLEAAARTGIRLPADRLPLLMNLAIRDPDLSLALGPVLGERGYWLAAQNPVWCRFRDDPDEIWARGKPADRLFLLHRLRRHQPEQARQRWQQALEQFAARDRHKLLPVLEDGLSEADRPLLEAMLDDRSDPLKSKVRQLLARLPEGDQGQRPDRSPAAQSRDQEPVVIALLQSRPPDSQMLEGLMGHGPWSRALAEALLAALRRAPETQSRPPDNLPALADHIPPDCREDWHNGWPGQARHWLQWSGPVHRLRQNLDWRQCLEQTFKDIP